MKTIIGFVIFLVFNIKQGFVLKFSKIDKSSFAHLLPIVCPPTITKCIHWKPFHRDDEETNEWMKTTKRELDCSTIQTSLSLLSQILKLQTKNCKNIFLCINCKWERPVSFESFLQLTDQENRKHYLSYNGLQQALIVITGLFDKLWSGQKWWH